MLPDFQVFEYPPRLLTLHRLLPQTLSLPITLHLCFCFIPNFSFLSPGSGLLFFAHYVTAHVCPIPALTVYPGRPHMYTVVGREHRISFSSHLGASELQGVF